SLALKIREQAEEEIRQRQAALQRQEEKLAEKDSHLDERRRQLDAREEAVHRERKGLSQLEGEYTLKTKQLEAELASLGSIDRDRARELFLSKIEHEFTEIGLRKAREIEANATREAE